MGALTVIFKRLRRSGQAEMEDSVVTGASHEGSSLRSQGEESDTNT
jgi:hypothetical protein